MGRLNAGDLTERVRLILPGPSVPDGRGGQKPGGVEGATHERAAAVRVLRAAERTRNGLPITSQAWEVTVRAQHPLAQDPFLQAAKGQLEWNNETAAILSVEPDPRREFFTLFVSNHRG